MYFYTFCNQIRALLTHLREALASYDLCLLTQRMLKMTKNFFICLMDQVNVCKSKNIFDFFEVTQPTNLIQKDYISLYLSKRLCSTYAFPTTIQMCVLRDMFFVIFVYLKVASDYYFGIQ